MRYARQWCTIAPSFIDTDGAIVHHVDMNEGRIAQKTGFYAYYLGRSTSEHGPARFFESSATARAWARSTKAPQSVVVLELEEGDCIRWLDSDVKRLNDRYGLRF